MALYKCTKCPHTQPVTNEYIGKVANCPKCGTKNRILGDQASKPSASNSGLNNSKVVAGKYSLNQFLQNTLQKDRGQGFFELESERILEVNLNNQETWIKTGAMISYEGQVQFVREKILEFGWKKAFKKFFTSEGATLTNATGVGKLYLADEGKKISIIQLNDETIYVNGSDLLAFEKSLSWDIKFLKQVGAWLSGGLFNVKISGKGMVAISTHYDPLTLPVKPGANLYTDPNATVAWSGGLEPKFKTDVQVKTFFGRGSGESIQMNFEGQGFVVVQPFEEVPVHPNSPSGGTGSPAAKIAAGVFAVVIVVVGLAIELGKNGQFEKLLTSILGETQTSNNAQMEKIRQRKMQFKRMRAKNKFKPQPLNPKVQPNKASDKTQRLPASQTQTQDQTQPANAVMPVDSKK
jgi:uncharacterized protein (AIM24 family)/DNA-directed RNA polymerase subunit RPC12/RpoP